MNTAEYVVLIVVSNVFSEIVPCDTSSIDIHTKFFEAAKQLNDLLRFPADVILFIITNNTPWQTALHSILASRGLRLIRNGDIYWIGPNAEIAAFQKHRREDAALPFGGEHINSPRQILIEARIVEADERFARELGAKLDYQASSINGITDSKLGTSLNLGGAGLNGFNPAAVAATLLSKNASRLLQMELSALESEGQGKILSNPRIMTGDQVKATIE